MKKKVILIVIAVLLAVLAGYTGYRFAKRGTDIVGVTTLSDKNTVIMNAKTGNEFVSGTGYLTVAEGEGLHLEYDLSSGSFDVAFRADEEGVAAAQAMDLENLPTEENMTGEGSFGKQELTGKGSLDFEAEPGSYTVHITNHGAIGKATVTAKK